MKIKLKKNGVFSIVRIYRQKRGAIIAESAFVLWFWIIVLLGLVDIGFLIIGFFSMSTVARESATQLAILPLYTGSNPVFAISGQVNLEDTTAPVCDFQEVLDTSDMVSLVNCKVYNVVSSNSRSKFLFADNKVVNYAVGCVLDPIVVPGVPQTNMGPCPPGITPVIRIHLSGSYKPPFGNFTPGSWMNFIAPNSLRLRGFADSLYLWPPFENRSI